MPGLGASFGRGAATTYQQDLANSDCVLFMGSNMAEAHPVAFRWPMKAKEKGATLIHVDPRYTRMSALCDVHVGIRAGSDIAFLGGLVNYVLSHDRWFKEYVLNYTNASTIVQEGFRDTEDLDGLFSGYEGDGKTGRYDARKGRWGYASAAEAEERLERRDSDVPDAEAGTRDERPQPRGREFLALRNATGDDDRGGGRAGQRPHAAAPALRLSDSETPLRSLHAGSRIPGVRLRRRKSWCGWRSCCAPTPGVSGPAPWSTRWGGPSTPPACR